MINDMSKSPLPPFIFICVFLFHSKLIGSELWAPSFSNKRKKKVDEKECFAVRMSLLNPHYISQPTFFIYHYFPRGSFRENFLHRASIYAVSGYGRS